MVRISPFTDLCPAVRLLKAILIIRTLSVIVSYSKETFSIDNNTINNKQVLIGVWMGLRTLRTYVATGGGYLAIREDGRCPKTVTKWCLRAAHRSRARPPPPWSDDIVRVWETSVWGLHGTEGSGVLGRTPTPSNQWADMLIVNNKHLLLIRIHNICLVTNLLIMLVEKNIIYHGSTIRGNHIEWPDAFVKWTISFVSCYSQEAVGTGARGFKDGCRFPIMAWTPSVHTFANIVDVLQWRGTP